MDPEERKIQHFKIFLGIVAISLGVGWGIWVLRLLTIIANKP